MAERRVAIGCWYRHRKGGLYIVEDVALESTSGRPRERIVVYRGTRGLNVRTEREFLEDVDGEPRFALTSDSTEPGAPLRLTALEMQVVSDALLAMDSQRSYRHDYEPTAKDRARDAALKRARIKLLEQAASDKQAEGVNPKVEQ